MRQKLAIFCVDEGEEDLDFSVDSSHSGRQRVSKSVENSNSSEAASAENLALSR